VIDYDKVFNAFVAIAKSAVGSQLSQVGPTGNTFPAVIRARQSGPTPSYPYVQLDLLSTVQTENWLLSESFNEDGFVVYETPYKLLLQYTVYGGNANKIAHELEAFFRLNSVLDCIENETTGTIEETFAVRSFPIKLSTAWLEVASFTLTFNINDEYVNDQPQAVDVYTNTPLEDGYFDTIIIDGEAKRNPDDDEPLTFSVTETSNP